MKNETDEVLIEKEKLEPAPAEPGVNPNAAVNVTEKWDEKDVGPGRGKATGLFNLDKISWKSLLWVVAAIIAIVLVMKMLSMRGKDERSAKYAEIERYISNKRRRE